MAKMRVKWNMKAWTALRNAPGVMADLDARASVGTTDYKSRRKQADENVLQRALNAGRG